MLSAVDPADMRRLAIRRPSPFIVREAPLLAVLALYALVVVATLPQQLVQDSWLALVAGREIVEHGLPRTETLTVWAQGTPWVDQQWLAQLGLYGLVSLGGLKLLMVFHAGLLITALGSALFAARSLGGGPRSVAMVALVGMLAAPWALQLRAQSFAPLLFVWVLYLLAADSRQPSRRVLLVLPLLALWANVHGTAALGALLALLAGLTSLARHDRRRAPGVPRRAIVLMLSPALLLASPYSLELPGYYRHMLADSTLSRFVDEWRPSEPAARTALFYLLALATVWIVARHGRRLTLFEQLALLVTGVAGLAAIRSISWFALTTIVLLPVALEGTAARTPWLRADRIRPALGLLALCAVLGSAAFALERPGSWFTSRWPTAAAQAVGTAAGSPSTRVFADDAHADWLLWELPDLRGRIAYDVRFELLSRGQLDRLLAYENRIGEGWRRAAAGYAVLTVDLRANPTLWPAMLARSNSRIIYRGNGLGVFARRPT